MKPKFLYLLFFFIISCTTNIVDTPEPTSTPLLNESPSPEQNPSFAPANISYLKLNTDKICYNKEIIITGKVDSNIIGTDKGNLSIYIEDITNSEGKVPPLRYDHILLKKLDVQSNIEFNYSFKIESVLKSFDDNTNLELKPGKYSVYIESLNNSLYGVGSFEIINCQ